MRVLTVAAVVALALCPIGLAESGAKPSKPKLDLRAFPRIAFSPVEVQFTAEVTGGNQVDDDYRCPEVEWSWDDGGRSVREADCAPDQDSSEIERRFSARHVYRSEGVYNVKVSMRRADRQFAQATATINVRSGLQ